jgi:2-polyprenyl-6-methoxyphenol hydroxylase-like FAD-dependent oxidoreductase
MPRYRIGVVGFGMGGATTATLLARDGHEVELLERASDLQPVGAGIMLQPSGQAILRQLGQLDRVIAHAAPLDELLALHAYGKGQLVCNVYGQYESGSRAYGVHRGVLFEALKSAVESQPVRITTNTEIATRMIDGSRVWLQDTQGKRHGPYDFVVCCDGSRSHLRHWMGHRQWVWKYGHGTLWAIVPATKVQGRLLQVVKGTRQLCGVLPIGDGLTTLYWGLPQRELEATKARGIEPLKRDIVAFCPEAAECVESIVDFEQLLFTNYQHVWMSRRFDRHAIFIGDAAHAMSPHLGQGINLAMVDANTLAGAIRDTQRPEEAFRLFEQRQAGYIRYYSAVTFFLSPFFQSDWRILGWGRDRVLPWLPRIPIIRRQMLMTVSGLKSGFLLGRRAL